MTRALPFALVLLLAACSGGGGVLAVLPDDPSPDGQACRREAERDPQVQAIANSRVVGNIAQEQRVRIELLDALPRAYDACMLRRGATPAGGVERLRPRVY